MTYPALLRTFPLCFLLLTIVAYTQESVFIVGKVVDVNGVPIPEATVRIIAADKESPVETITDIDGSFRLQIWAQGICRFVVEMTGFQTATRDGVDTALEENRTLTIALQSSPRSRRLPAANEGAGRRGANMPPGFQSAQVSDLPGMELFRTDPAQFGAEEGPGITGRDPSDFLMISGGGASLDAGDWNDPNFRQRMMDTARQMGFRLEIIPGLGVPPGMEGSALGGAANQVGAGFTGMAGGSTQGLAGGVMGPGGGMGPGSRMPGGGGPGFMGMSAGRGVRGTLFQQPKIQGSVSETYGNSGLNASPYSLAGLSIAEPLHIQNNFSINVGGTLPWMERSSTGAPVGPPGRLRGGRAGGPPSWLFTYSGTRNRDPYDVFSTVPSELERRGDFSNTSLPSGPLAGKPVELYDPASDTPIFFPDAKIPLDRMDPTALALLEYIPLPNLPGSVQNYFYSRSLRNTSDQFQGRISGIRLTSKDNIGFNYSLRRGNSISSQIYPGLESIRKNLGQQIGLTGMHQFQNRLISNWRISLNRNRTESTNAFAYKHNVAAELGIGGVSQDPINWGIPAISFTNYGDLQLAAPSLNRMQTLSISLGLMKIGTPHSVRAGGDVSWNQRNQLMDINPRGAFSFTGYATSLFNPEGLPVAGTGYDFSDFLLGLPYSTSRRFGSSNNYLRSRSFSLYVEDSWRARSNLTISMGLRYEYSGPAFEKYDRLVSLDAAPGFVSVAQVFPDQTGPLSGQYFSRSLVNPDWNNFGPRIGLAWKPTATSRFVFRAGYGIFYNASAYSSIAGQLVGQPPFAVNQDILTTISNPLTIRQGFPIDPDLTILNTYSVDPNYRPAYVQQWNLDIQTQIAGLYVLQIGYNGSKGTGLDILRAPNRSPSGSVPGDLGNISNAGNFTYQSNGACSIMHALSVSLVRRFSQGLNIRNSYTLSKSIDGASGIGGGLIVVQNDDNIAAERALSSFDQRHNFTVNFNYELPMGQNRRFFANSSAKVLNFVSGWSISGDFRLSSGTPLTARILGNISNNSGTGLGANNSERPDATGISISLPREHRTTTQFFNTLAFAIPAPGLFGNAGRNTITGPGTNLMNVMLRKSFSLGEYSRRIDLSWQVSNAFNHPNWGGLGTIINAQNFGRVTSVRTMRQMTLNLRISF